MSEPTRSQVSAVLQMLRIVADAIKALGQVPSGELYAVLMPRMSLTTYEKMLSLLESSGVVTVSNHLITWVGVPAQSIDK